MDHQTPFCSTCETFMKAWTASIESLPPGAERSWRFEYELDLKDTFSNAIDSCVFCAQIVRKSEIFDRAARWFSSNSDKPDNLKKVVRLSRSPGGPGGYSLSMGDLGFTFYFLRQQPDSLSYDHLMQSCTDSKESWKLITSWIGSCQEGHDCGATISSAELPTRLLRIKSGPDGGYTLRLVESKNLDPSSMTTRYCTLSHCWGDGNFLKLVRENYEAFLKGVRYCDVSPNFRDAVHVARSLGFIYIWIDSLCIIQGDAEDWMREAGRMSDVYSGSSLNIAATSWKDGNAGFFTERSKTIITSLLPCIIKCQDYKSSYILVENNERFDLVADSVIASRGWILQERFLSPRTVHFTSKQIFWECGAGNASERHPWMAFESEPLYGNIPITRSYSLKKGWERIVTAYSSASLSYDSDKFIALQGIIKFLSRRFKRRYIVGFWDDGSLEEQLLWTTTPGLDDSVHQENSVDRRREGRRSCDFFAPTWSWISVIDVPVSRAIMDRNSTRRPGFKVSSYQVISKYSTAAAAATATTTSIDTAVDDDDYDDSNHHFLGEPTTVTLTVKCSGLKCISISSLNRVFSHHHHHSKPEELIACDTADTMEFFWDIPDECSSSDSLNDENNERVYYLLATHDSTSWKDLWGLVLRRVDFASSSNGCDDDDNDVEKKNSGGYFKRLGLFKASWREEIYDIQRMVSSKDINTHIENGRVTIGNNNIDKPSQRMNCPCSRLSRELLPRSSSSENDDIDAGRRRAAIVHVRDYVDDDEHNRYNYIDDYDIDIYSPNYNDDNYYNGSYRSNDDYKKNEREIDGEEREFNRSLYRTIKQERKDFGNRSWLWENLKDAPEEVYHKRLESSEEGGEERFEIVLV